MKYGIATLILVAIASAGATACDVCGCSLGANYFGILPLYNKNFVGLRWSQASFHSYIAPTQNLDAQTSDDTYSKMELWSRYYLSKRVQLFAFIPYVYNDMNGTDQKVHAQGLGDISVMGNYAIVDTGNENKDFKHLLMAGGGLKLPTGHFSLTDKGKIINRNFQMGTGSVDFNINMVYTVRYKKTGINLETGYKINTRNSSGYLFGNQYRASAQAFVWQKFGDIYISRFTVGVNYQKPVTQHYNSDVTAKITGNARWTASFTFNF